MCQGQCWGLITQRWLELSLCPKHLHGERDKLSTRQRLPWRLYGAMVPPRGQRASLGSSGRAAEASWRRRCLKDGGVSRAEEEGGSRDKYAKALRYKAAYTLLKPEPRSPARARRGEALDE